MVAIQAGPKHGPFSVFGIRSGIATLIALIFSWSPVWGEQPASDPGGDEIRYLHLPGYEGDSGRWSLTFEIAPQIVAHNPLRRGSETSDALDLSLTLASRQPLGEALEVEFDAGASKTIDNGSFSQLAAGMELRTRPGASGFSGFAGYTISRDYRAFFDRGEGTSHRFAAGLRFGRAIGATEIGFELAPRWVESSAGAEDHGAVTLSGEAVMSLVPNRILLILDLAAERRWYEDRDPLLGIRRRDWRFATYAGLDLAGLVVPDRARPGLRDLIVGAEWLEISSNVDSRDRSSLSLLPMVSIGLSF